MRLIATVCLGIVGLLSLPQNADAAFSFVLSPAAASGLPGSGITINVTVFDDLAAPNSFFTIGSVTPVNSAPGVVTLSGFSSAGGLATTAGNPLGSFTATINPLALNGQFSDISLNFNNVNGLLGGTLGNTALISSNTVRITAVPEPSSLALLGIASFGAVAFRRRRK